MTDVNKFYQPIRSQLFLVALVLVHIDAYQSFFMFLTSKMYVFFIKKKTLIEGLHNWKEKGLHKWHIFFYFIKDNWLLFLIELRQFGDGQWHLMGSFFEASLDVSVDHAI